jgi:hypothetical protein
MQDNPLLEQLDWLFTSMHWTLSYPATVVLPQGNPTSDHIPLLVSIQSSIPSSKLFRFENFWIAHPRFLEVVAKTWDKPTHKPSSAANLNEKFKRMRYELKKWSKSISKLSICIDNCNKALFRLDQLEDMRGLTVPENNFRKILKKHLLCLLDYQQQYWKKRCTVRWTKFGDENTKFFQAMATERYRRNSISQLTLSDGTIVTEHKEKKLIFNTYKERLGTSHAPEMLFDLQHIIQPVPGLEELSVPFTT